MAATPSPARRFASRSAWASPRSDKGMSGVWRMRAAFEAVSPWRTRRIDIATERSRGGSFSTDDGRVPRAAAARAQPRRAQGRPNGHGHALGVRLAVALRPRARLPGADHQAPAPALDLPRAVLVHPR